VELLLVFPSRWKSESCVIEFNLVKGQLLRLMVDKEPNLPNDDVKPLSDVQDEARDVQDELWLKPSAHASAC
jgi:hypothetical protein